mmetsp:Transcript_25349/g.38089  ORF Transcript_25349/g.38089 Transcript_25349/m.38089 type:complete len:142 (+) Transcript_25349:216-641(+)
MYNYTRNLIRSNRPGRPCMSFPLRICCNQHPAMMHTLHYFSAASSLEFSFIPTTKKQIVMMGMMNKINPAVLQNQTAGIYFFGKQCTHMEDLYIYLFFFFLFFIPPCCLPTAAEVGAGAFSSFPSSGSNMEKDKHPAINKA